MITYVDYIAKELVFLVVFRATGNPDSAAVVKMAKYDSSADRSSLDQTTVIGEPIYHCSCTYHCVLHFSNDFE